MTGCRRDECLDLLVGCRIALARGPHGHLRNEHVVVTEQVDE